MEYALFLGFQRIGTLFPNIEEAKKEIKESGIYNICGVLPIDGKLKIVSRESIRK